MPASSRGGSRPAPAHADCWFHPGGDGEVFSLADVEARVRANPAEAEVFRLCGGMTYAEFRACPPCPAGAAEPAWYDEESDPWTTPAVVALVRADPAAALRFRDARGRRFGECPVPL